MQIVTSYRYSSLSSFVFASVCIATLHYILFCPLRTYVCAPNRTQTPYKHLLFFSRDSSSILSQTKREHHIHMTLPKYHNTPALHPDTTPLHQRYNVTESAKKHIITLISMILNTIIFTIGHFCTMESLLLLNPYYNIHQ